VRREALRAERYPIHAGRAIFLKAAALDGARIGLQGNFGILRERDPAPQRGEQTCETLGRKQARSAAAEEHRLDPALLQLRQLGVEVADQDIDIALGWGLRFERVGVEVAVWTLAHTPGQVHIE